MAMAPNTTIIMTVATKKLRDSLRWASAGGQRNHSVHSMWQTWTVVMAEMMSRAAAEPLRLYAANIEYHPMVMAEMMSRAADALSLCGKDRQR